MRRADRLFQLIQLLRRRNVATAAWLARELEVSERTVYRDVRDLMLSGVPIEGEAGVGYVLRRGFDATLPVVEYLLRKGEIPAPSGGDGRHARGRQQAAEQGRLHHPAVLEGNARGSQQQGTRSLGCGTRDCHQRARGRIPEEGRSAPPQYP
jgi:biotin operon repressor